MRSTSGAFLCLEVFCVGQPCRTRCTGWLSSLALEEEIGEKSKSKVTPNRPCVTL